MRGKTIHAACLQLCSTDNVDENIAAIRAILADHQAAQFELIVLPENAALITDDPVLRKRSAQPQAYQRIFKAYADMAKHYQTWLIAGTLLIQDPENQEKLLNHCPVFAPDGRLVCSYNKMHLFDADLGSESWLESSLITAGKQPVSITLNNDWQAGLSICYDLRFPELYRHYSQHGCNILTVPAAFTVPTGEAHWEVLLRARAIENQSFVLAPGQYGTHQDGRKTYGHSMIIDPWGKVMAQLGSGVGLISALLSQEQLNRIQQKMPVLHHRRLS